MPEEKTKTKGHISEKLEQKLKGRLPDDFDLSIIGKIDLKEAEKIASENIVFLTEDDLIEGLESFELKPIEIPESEAKSIIPQEPEAKSTDVDEGVKKADDLSIQDEDVFVAFDDNTLFDEENTREKPEEIENPVPENVEESNLESVESFSEIEKSSVEERTIERDVEESALEEEETYVFADEEVLEVDLSDYSEEKDLSDEIELKQRLDEKNIRDSFDDLKTTSHHVEDPLPPAYNFRKKDRAIFIDDFVQGEKDEVVTTYRKDPLTASLVSMVDISEGNIVVVEDVGSHELFSYELDNTQIYNPDSIELLLREEQFFADYDLDFIDNAIVRDDFTVYIQEIDDYLKTMDILSSSEIQEILGLAPDELEFINEKLFADYYKDADTELELEFLTPDLSFFDKGFLSQKNVSYFLPYADSLSEEEMKSIEEDISSEQAIVFEEDIEDIKQLLEEEIEKEGFREDDLIAPEVDVEAGELDENQESPEDIITDITKELSEIKEIEERVVEEAVEDRAEFVEEIADITDRIIILEDKEELEKVVSDYPAKKKELLRLLSYLDGLMEKLPEESIRKFAESEYFDLYVKILKELGM